MYPCYSKPRLFRVIPKRSKVTSTDLAPLRPWFSSLNQGKRERGAEKVSLTEFNFDSRFECKIHEREKRTRGQWPYRLRSTRAMINLSSNSGGLICVHGLQTALEAQFDLIFETSRLNYCGIHVHIASNSHFGGL